MKKEKKTRLIKDLKEAQKKLAEIRQETEAIKNRPKP